MPKSKTHKGIAKRVKVTRSGKVLRRKAGKSHLLSVKNAKRRRHLKKVAEVPGEIGRKYKVLLGPGM